MWVVLVWVIGNNVAMNMLAFHAHTCFLMDICTYFCWVFLGVKLPCFSFNTSFTLTYLCLIQLSVMLFLALFIWIFSLFFPLSMPYDRFQLTPTDNFKVVASLALPVAVLSHSLMPGGRLICCRVPFFQLRIFWSVLPFSHQP